MYSYIVLGGIVSFAIASFLYAYTKPNSIIYQITFLSLVMNGPKFFGYHIFEEVCLATAILGYYLATSISGRRLYFPVVSVHDLLPLLFISYLFVSSVVGLLFVDERNLRFSLLYILVFFIYIIFNSVKFDRDVLLKVVVFACFLSSSAYLAQGIGFEIYYGIGTWGRFKSQEAIWAGSAYITLITAIGFASSLLFIKKNPGKLNFICMANIFIAVIIGFYFYSRATFLSIVILFVPYLSIKYIKNLIVFTVVFIVGLFLTYNSSKEIINFFVDMASIGKIFTNPEPSDITRNIQVRAAFQAWSASDNSFLGNGFYSHKELISHSYNKLFLTEVPKSYYRALCGLCERGVNIILPSTTRTTGFAALLVDTGALGIALLAGSIINAILFGLRYSKTFLAFLSLLIVVFLWFFLSNINDVVVVSMLLIPSCLPQVFTYKYDEKNNLCSTRG